MIKKELINTLLQLSFILFLFSCAASKSYISKQETKSDWIPVNKYNISDTNTYEAKLQDVFTNYLNNDCSCNQGYNNTLDYIPRDFRKTIGDIDLQTKCKVVHNANMLSLLVYPFSESDKSKSIENIDFKNESLSLVDSIISSLEFENFKYGNGIYQYRSSCSHYLGSYLIQNLNVPNDVLKIGFNKDFESENGLFCFGGDGVISPVTNILSSQSSIKTKLLFHLWDYYKKSKSSNGLYYQTKFSGSSFITSLNNENIDLKLTKCTSIEYLIRNTRKWTSILNTNLDYSGLGNLNSYPSVNQIAKYFSDTLEPETIDNKETMYQNVRHQHSITFSGIPEKFRNAEDWEIEISDGKKIYRELPIISIDKQTGNDVCTFKITGKPYYDLFNPHCSSFW